MGCLINCDTSDFLLRKTSFEARTGSTAYACERTTRRVRRSGWDPRRKGLADAFQAAYFEVECSDAGDMIRVTYIADKAPPDSSDQWPDAIFYGIAPWIERGTIRGSVDDYQWEIEVAEGRILG